MPPNSCAWKSVPFRGSSSHGCDRRSSLSPISYNVRMTAPVPQDAFDGDDSTARTWPDGQPSVLDSPTGARFSSNGYLPPLL